jgi:hypothetical protein
MHLLDSNRVGTPCQFERLTHAGGQSVTLAAVGFVGITANDYFSDLLHFVVLDCLD